MPGEKPAQSTISRLESKYSDILDRVAKRKQKLQQEREDRDKTLEPDDYRRTKVPTPLSKSQTTASILKADKKERTPFRLDRHKFGLDSDAKIKRTELLGLDSSSNLSNYHDSYTKMKSNDSGYYDGYRGYGKENIYKSKYDPDLLLSESSSNNGIRRSSAAQNQQQQPYAGSSTSRQIKAYKRTESGDKRRTAINLYELLNDDDDLGLDNRPQRRTFMQRKSTGNQLRFDRLENQRRDDAHDDLMDLEKTERENKRKEIQSLIQKYAQMDDFYGKSSMQNGASELERDANNNHNVSSPVVAKVDPWDSKAKHSPIVIPKKSVNPLGKSQTMANIHSPYDGSNFSSWYNLNYNNSIVPIKTNVTPTSSKSRMTKALSTFVRQLKEEFSL